MTLLERRGRAEAAHLLLQIGWRLRLPERNAAVITQQPTANTPPIARTPSLNCHCVSSTSSYTLAQVHPPAWPYWLVISSLRGPHNSFLPVCEHARTFILQLLHLQALYTSMCVLQSVAVSAPITAPQFFWFFSSDCTSPHFLFLLSPLLSFPALLLSNSGLSFPIFSCRCAVSLYLSFHLLLLPVFRWIDAPPSLSGWYYG